MTSIAEEEALRRLVTEARADRAEAATHPQAWWLGR